MGPTFANAPPAARRTYSEGNHRIDRRAGWRIEGSLEAAAQPIARCVFQGAANDKLVRTRSPRCVRSERPGAFADRQPSSACHSTSAGVGDGQVARVPASIGRQEPRRGAAVTRPVRRHFPRRCDRAGLIRGSTLHRLMGSPSSARDTSSPIDRIGPNSAAHSVRS